MLYIHKNLYIYKIYEDIGRYIIYNVWCFGNKFLCILVWRCLTYFDLDFLISFINIVLFMLLCCINNSCWINFAYSLFCKEIVKSIENYIRICITKKLINYGKIKSIFNYYFLGPKLSQTFKLLRFTLGFQTKFTY